MTPLFGITTYTLEKVTQGVMSVSRLFLRRWWALWEGAMMKAERVTLLYLWERPYVLVIFSQKEKETRLILRELE